MCRGDGMDKSWNWGYIRQTPRLAISWPLPFNYRGRWPSFRLQKGWTRRWPQWRDCQQIPGEDTLTTTYQHWIGRFILAYAVAQSKLYLPTNEKISEKGAGGLQERLDRLDPEKPSCTEYSRANCTTNPFSMIPSLDSEFAKCRNKPFYSHKPDILGTREQKGV